MFKFKYLLYSNKCQSLSLVRENKPAKYMYIWYINWYFTSSSHCQIVRYKTIFATNFQWKFMFLFCWQSQFLNMINGIFMASRNQDFLQSSTSFPALIERTLRKVTEYCPHCAIWHYTSIMLPGEGNNTFVYEVQLKLSNIITLIF